MTEQKNKIPIKGYATFDPLKHCWIGSGFKAEWFHDLPIYKNNKIMDPIKRIADETEEDYQKLISLLEKFDVKVIRTDISDDSEDHKKPNGGMMSPPMAPRGATQRDARCGP